MLDVRSGIVTVTASAPRDLTVERRSGDVSFEQAEREADAESFIGVVEENVADLARHLARA